jgi:hypothetical protein
MFLAIYRAPTGDFETFLNKLDSIMNYLYKPKTEFVICGTINIDYLSESYRKQRLNSLRASFNLTSIVSFPTRIQNSSNSAIDNIFIDSSRLEHISIKPEINGLSEHDVQLLVIKNINPIPNFHNYKKVTRVVNDVTINEFIRNLSSEDWELLYNGGDVDSNFNSFLYIFLKIFEKASLLKWRKSCLKPMNGYLKAAKHHAHISELFTKLAEPVTTNY